MMVGLPIMGLNQFTYSNSNSFPDIRDDTSISDNYMCGFYCRDFSSPSNNTIYLVGGSNADYYFNWSAAWASKPTISHTDNTTTITFVAGSGSGRWAYGGYWFVMWD